MFKQIRLYFAITENNTLKYYMLLSMFFSLCINYVNLLLQIHSVLSNIKFIWDFPKNAFNPHNYQKIKMTHQSYIIKIQGYFNTVCKVTNKNLLKSMVQFQILFFNEKLKTISRTKYFSCLKHLLK